VLAPALVALSLSTPTLQGSLSTRAALGGEPIARAGRWDVYVAAGLNNAGAAIKDEKGLRPAVALSALFDGAAAAGLGEERDDLFDRFAAPPRIQRGQRSSFSFDAMRGSPWRLQAQWTAVKEKRRGATLLEKEEAVLTAYRADNSPLELRRGLWAMAGYRELRDEAGSSYGAGGAVGYIRERAWRTPFSRSAAKKPPLNLFEWTAFAESWPDAGLAAGLAAQATLRANKYLTLVGSGLLAWHIDAPAGRAAGLRIGGRLNTRGSKKPPNQDPRGPIGAP
jgi:hypothetical protein